MQAVQVQTIIRAINMLKAAGAKFKVITEDGDEYGDLEVVIPKQRKHMDRSAMHERLKIKERIGAMKVGDVEVFTLPPDMHTENLDPSKLQSIIAGHCTNVLGKGACTTHRNGDSVEVLRIN